MSSVSKHILEAVSEQLCRPALAHAIARSAEKALAVPMIWLEIDRDKRKYRQKAGPKGKWSAWQHWDPKAAGFGFSRDKKWRIRDDGVWSNWKEPRNWR